MNCAVNGSSTFVSRALRYDSETGKMNGTITTNQCPDHEVAGQPAGKCVEQTIPDPSFRTGNIDAAPLLGRVAMALRTGGDIFGPMDNGFEEGRVCEGGSCVAGTDLHSCKSHLEATCTGEINAGMLMDRCGGHASPYHFHKDLACHYRASDDSVHSPAVAVALDGHLIYGKWEGSRKRPILDACNGHTGIVPSSDYHEAGTEPVYHYHLTPTPPFVLGCFGPADSIKACRAQYPACRDDAYATRMNAPGSPPKAFEVRRWCTCYQHEGSTLYGNLFEPPADSDTEEDVPSLMGPGNPDRAANAAAGEQSDRAADAAASEDRTERETTPAPTPGRGRPSRPRTRDVVALVVGLPFSREEFDEARQTKFREGVAQSAGVDVDRVFITGIAASGGRRRLLAARLEVTCEIEAESPELAESLAAAISPTAVTETLQSMGLPSASVMTAPAPAMASSEDDAGSVVTELQPSSSAPGGPRSPLCLLSAGGAVLLALVLQHVF